MSLPNGSEQRDNWQNLLNNPSLNVEVTQAAQVGDARRQATLLAQKLGFDEAECGKISLIVTEAANNLVKHGTGGNMLFTARLSTIGPGIDILAIDSGPGMASVAQCLTDGYSTAGTPGTGLGAIQRLSSTFDIYSLKGQGTVLYARCETAVTNASSLPDVGAVCVPAPGETESGDAWAVQAHGERTYFLMADGLGHGPQAAEAAQAATRVFRERAGQDEAGGLLEILHAALRGTRGAAAAIAVLDLQRQELVYAGIGNIAGAIVSGMESHSLVSLSGIVGHQIRKVQTFTYACPPGALLILHSDGLGTQWRLDRYPGLAQRAPAVVAGVLYRDCKRGRDDASVLVARCRK